MKAGFDLGAHIHTIALILCLTTEAGKPVAAHETQNSPWGAAEEIGTLNTMTDRSRLDLLRVVSDGRVYDLGVELSVGMPDCCSDAFGGPSCQLMMIRSPARFASLRYAQICYAPVAIASRRYAY